MLSLIDIPANSFHLKTHCENEPSHECGLKCILEKFMSQSSKLYVIMIRISNHMLSPNMIFGTPTHIGFGLTKSVILEEMVQILRFSHGILSLKIKTFEI